MIYPRASAFWVRLKANRLAYTLTILATLAIGILIGTTVSRGVKGQESKKGSDATPLSVPTPKELSNQFSQISKQLERAWSISIRNLRSKRSAGAVAPQARRERIRIRLMISSTASSGARVAAILDQFANVRWDLVCWLIPRATSLLTVTWWRKQTAFA